jgi:hypothetical protein
MLQNRKKLRNFSKVKKQKGVGAKILYLKRNIQRTLVIEMSEKKNKNDVAIGLAIGLGVLCVVLAVLLIFMAFDYIPTINGTQNNAYLVNVGLGASDEGNGVMHIQGYVVNTGSSTAYHAQLHVVAYYVSGAKAIDTYVTIGSGIIASRDAVQIDTTVSYSNSGVGIAAATATLTPEWANSA